MANLIYTVPLATSLKANSNVDVYIGGGANTQALTTDGLGNLRWSNVGSGNGTVTNIATSGSGLGFSLTGGPITTTGTITLTIPNATSLRSSLTIGNVANLNLVGNGTLFLNGNGGWTVPTGTYSNANVANYLPNYPGNIGSSGSNAGANYIWANYIQARETSYANIFQASNLFTGPVGNITTINSTTGNFSGNVNANIVIANTGNITTINSNIVVANTGNITTINSTTGNITTINATTGNFSGNIIALNANLGNLARANFFQGDGGLLTNITANFANYAGNITISSQPNITSVGTLVSLSVSGNANIGNIGSAGNITGNNVIAQNQLISNVSTGTPPIVVNSTTLVPNLNVANATFATSAGSATTAGTVTTAAQPNITSVGNLTSLTVTGNVTANYFLGNGSQLTGIATSANANYANYAGNVTISSQPNITSVGTLSSLTANGTINFTNASNVSLGPVGNVKITGGINGYYLQTDGAGNMSWVSGGGSGNGTVGGSNTQIQFNDAGSFGGNSALTFNKTSGITSIDSGNIRGIIRNQGNFSNTTITANLILNFDILSGPIMINNGINVSTYFAANANYNYALNFRGNATTTLNSLMNVGDTIDLVYMQIISVTNTAGPNNAVSLTANINIGNIMGPVGFSGPLNQIDGTNIPAYANMEARTGVSGFQYLQFGNNYSGNYAGTFDLGTNVNRVYITNQISNNTAYGYVIQNYSITKINSTPTFLITAGLST